MIKDCMKLAYLFVKEDTACKWFFLLVLTYMQLFVRSAEIPEEPFARVAYNVAHGNFQTA